MNDAGAVGLRLLGLDYCQLFLLLDSDVLDAIKDVTDSILVVNLKAIKRRLKLPRGGFKDLGDDVSDFKLFDESRFLFLVNDLKLNYDLFLVA